MEDVLYGILGLIIMFTFTFVITQLSIFNLQNKQTIRSKNRYIKVLERKIKEVK